MKNFCVVTVALAVVVCPAGVLFGQAPSATGPSSPSSSFASVKWAGPAVSIDALRGKTVLVLIYATWCPKCNEWSGELFTQLKKTVKDKPIIILAINTDYSPRGVKEYLTARGFFALNILHGYDPGLPKN